MCTVVSIRHIFAAALGQSHEKTNQIISWDLKINFQRDIEYFMPRLLCASHACRWVRHMRIGLSLDNERYQTNVFTEYIITRKPRSATNRSWQSRITGHASSLS